MSSAKTFHLEVIQGLGYVLGRHRGASGVAHAMLVTTRLCQGKEQERDEGDTDVQAGCSHLGGDGDV